ncbi:IS66 family transposase [Candidatus Riflebacteria bacterium]
MKDATQNLPKSVEELNALIEQKEAIIEKKNAEIERLQEQVTFLNFQLYGRKSEKSLKENSNQLSFFDLPENPLEDESIETETVNIPEHIRRKKGRRKLPENLPRIDVIHDISEEEKRCACGHQMNRFGEDVSEKLDIIPAKIRVIRHIRPKYACKNCEGLEDDGPTIKIAAPPPQIIEKGLASPSLLAYCLVSKFCDALPFYRQEIIFKRIGIDIPRQTMCNWTIKTAEKCEPLAELLLEEIRSGPLIHIDETNVQVLKEPGRKATTKSYMWAIRGGQKDNPIILYHYHQSRGANVVKNLLEGFKGMVMSDGYAAYDFLDDVPGIIHLGCMAHARRKFTDCRTSGQGGRSKTAETAIKIFEKLYRIEKSASINELDFAEIKNLRTEKSRPLMNKLKNFLMGKMDHVPPKSLSGKAIHYALKQWARFERYLEYGRAPIDNNLVENAIRPFVVGRKNWLFSGTPEGAKASSLFYSLIETAKANQLEPFSYLKFLFEKIPVTTDSDFQILLPNRVKAEDIDNVKGSRAV